MRNKYLPGRLINSAILSLRDDLKIAFGRLNNKTDNIIPLNKMKKELKNIFKNK